MHVHSTAYVLCGRRAIAVYSRLRSLKFAYVSYCSGSHDFAGQAFLFLSGFLFSFFSPPISPVFLYLPKNLPDKEQKKEGLRRRLVVWYLGSECLSTVQSDNNSECVGEYLTSRLWAT